MVKILCFSLSTSTPGAQNNTLLFFVTVTCTFRGADGGRGGGRGGRGGECEGEEGEEPSSGPEVPGQETTQNRTAPEGELSTGAGFIVCWLLNVPATC